MTLNDLEPQNRCFQYNAVVPFLCVSWFILLRRTGTCRAGFHCTTAMQGKQANHSLDLAKSTSCNILSENMAINKTIMALFNFNNNKVRLRALWTSYLLNQLQKLVSFFNVKEFDIRTSSGAESLTSDDWSCSNWNTESWKRRGFVQTCAPFAVKASTTAVV